MNTLEIITQETERYFKLPPGSLQQKTHKRETAYPRQLAHTIAGYLDKDHRGRVIDSQAEKDIAILRLKVKKQLDRIPLKTLLANFTKRRVKLHYHFTFKIRVHYRRLVKAY